MKKGLGRILAALAKVLCAWVAMIILIGFGIIVIILQVLGKYMIIRYFDP